MSLFDGKFREDDYPDENGCHHHWLDESDPCPWCERDALKEEVERLKDDVFRIRLESQQLHSYLCEAISYMKDVSYEHRDDAVMVAALLDRIEYIAWKD